MEIMRKDLNDARDLHGQAESAAAVWKVSGLSWVLGTSRATKLSCWGLPGWLDRVTVGSLFSVCFS